VKGNDASEFMQNSRVESRLTGLFIRDPNHQDCTANEITIAAADLRELETEMRECGRGGRSLSRRIFSQLQFNAQFTDAAFVDTNSVVGA